MGGLCTLNFMNEMSNKIGKNYLLKKSVLLIKSWFTYEASLIGSYAACMATYGLYVLILFVINNFYDELSSPMDVFKKFFQVWGNFDWETNMISIYSPVKALNFYDKLKTEVRYKNSMKCSVDWTWTNLLCWKEACTLTTKIDHY